MLFAKRQQVFDFLISHGVKVLNSEILEFLFNGAYTQAVGNRRVYFQRFKGFVPLLLLRHSVDSAHIVKSVRKLYYDNPYVLTHCNKHFSKAFRLLLFFSGKIKPPYLCDAVNKERHIVPETALYVLKCGVGIFDNIVEERRGYRFAVHSEGDNNQCHIKWVDIIILVCTALLPFVLLHTVLKGFFNQIIVIIAPEILHLFV